MANVIFVFVYDYSVFCVMFIHDHYIECEQNADLLEIVSLITTT